MCGKKRERYSQSDRQKGRQRERNIEGKIERGEIEKTREREIAKEKGVFNKTLIHKTSSVQFELKTIMLTVDIQTDGWE